MKKIIMTAMAAAMLILGLTSCAPAGTGTQGANGNQMWLLLIVYVAIFVGIYFLMIRPNSKKKKAEQALRDNLEIGDEITTIGGIMGKVISIKEETDSIVIETGADRTRMQLKRWSISTVDTVKENEATPQAKPTGGFFGRKKKDSDENKGENK